MVFASPSANFCTGSNPCRLSGHSHRDNFIMTANSSPSIGTVQKHMPTPTQTASNPNPLAVRCYSFINPQTVPFVEFILTHKFQLSTMTKPSANYILRCPACPSLTFPTLRKPISCILSGLKTTTPNGFGTNPTYY